MKWLFAGLFFLILPARSQTVGEPVKLVQYVLDTFTTGSVKLKSGAVHSQKLNYNIVTAEMIFEQDGKYFAIANPEDVDTVFIAQRKFVLVGESFYEWLGGSTYPLFVEYTCTVKEPGAQTGFGTTNSTAATSFKSLAKEGGAYNLKLPEEYGVIPKQNFYIRKRKHYNKIGNERQLAELFPERKEQIKNWVKNHHTRFSRGDELLQLVQQIQE